MNTSVIMDTRQPRVTEDDNDISTPTLVTVVHRKNGKVVVPLNPVLHRKYTMEERRKLRAFERSIMEATKK